MSTHRCLIAAAFLCLLNTSWAERPNVIFFIVDDVSSDDFGCYGNRAARTPHIDALATGSLRFTQAFLTASSCSPSRSSIITSRYPHNLGPGAELHGPVAPHIPWLPGILKDAGYYTAIVGKNHMSRDKLPPGSTETAVANPWDHIDKGVTPNNHSGGALWVQTLEKRPKDKPFFFWFAAIDAHRGWDGDQEWDPALYGPKHRPEEVSVPPFLADAPNTRADLASHQNELTRFDYNVGQVVDGLRKSGLLENTLIFLLADNGRPFPRSKTRLHDSGMKTALLAHWPTGIRAGSCASLVSSIDLAPTVLDAAGLPVPPSMQGVSLRPLFANPSATVRQHAFSEHNWHDYEAHGRSIRDSGYLYIRNARPNLAWLGPVDSIQSPSHKDLVALRLQNGLSNAQADLFVQPRPEEELYATESDPHQLRNLAADPAHAETRLRLAQTLDLWIQQTGDAVPEKLRPDEYSREDGRALQPKPVSDLQTRLPGSPRDAAHINQSGPR
jgi:N-sulfoglucosamine sulfohydrolase